MGTTVYERLLCEALPEVIESDARYDEITSRLADLAGKGHRRTASETRLMRLLALLVEDYDRRHSLPPDESTPAGRLLYLLEMSGKPASALTAVFGQASHVSEALRGKRRIGLEQARRLALLFNVKPSFFLD